MNSPITIDGFTVDVTLKRMKYMHLRVHPPDGRIQVSAPNRTTLRVIQDFVRSKRDWILRQRKTVAEQAANRSATFENDEIHYVWGKPLRLQIIESPDTCGMEPTSDRLLMHVLPGTNRLRRKTMLDKWHTEQLARALPGLIKKWEPLIGVSVARVSVRPMKTRWGSCSIKSRRIRINTELAKRPPECLEYIIVHEMVHLLEPSHNKRFAALMNGFMPDWKNYRTLLNRFPISDA